MKKLNLLLLLLFANIVLATAQIKDTTYWKREFSVGVNVNQAYFNGNWKKTQGANANIAVSAFLFFKSEYVQYKHSIVNDLQLQYGKSFAEANLVPTWRKNLDRIFFDNKYAYAISPTLGVFASLLFQSQFDNGYKYDKFIQPTDGRRDSTSMISSFLSPGYLDEALGLEWKPVTYFSGRFGPVAFRQTFVINDRVRTNTAKPDRDGDLASYGVKVPNSVRNQFGYNVVLKFDRDFNPNFNLKLIYQYFSPYDNLAVSTNRLDAIVTAKVAKFINVNLQGVVLYNQDQIAQIQVSQALALGVVYLIADK